MKSSWFLPVIVLFVLLPTVTQAQDLEPETVAQSVVKIDVTYGQENNNESGTGVIITQTGIIFTNEHVVGQEDISEITISMTTNPGAPPEPLYNARIVYLSDDEDFDFAILQINTSIDETGFNLPVDPTTLELPFVEQWSDLDLRIQDTVFVAGYPASAGGNLFFDRGEVSGLSRNGDVTVAQADLAVSDGLSGGLVFDADGAMTGIVFEQLRAGADPVAPILTVQSICEQIPDECERYRPNPVTLNPVCELERARPYCENTQLNIGMTAQIGSLESQFQLRGDHFWEAQWLKPLPRGSFVTVVGGPQISLDDVLVGFELFWWQVEDDEGVRGWVVESFFGEPVLIPSRLDEPTISSSVCQLMTRTPANIRSGPGAEYEQIASRRFDEPLAADGQIRGGDGFIWWRLIPGFWVREDAVREDDTCFTLPVVEFP